MSPSKRGSTRSLEAYRAKRDFRKTPEPRGGVKASARQGAKKVGKQKKGLFFCVQKHLSSHLHYDFRLEHKGVLLSWALPKGPSINTQDKRLAVLTEDHPLEYGTFEGVIPEGYGAGIVVLWDMGIWRPEPGFEDVDEALEKGELKFELYGYKLKGSWVLVRIGGRTGDRRNWLLIKHRDEWSGPIDITDLAPLSVKSQGDFADVLAQDDPNIWRSHRPAKSGAAGRMLSEIIERAALLKVRRERKAPPRKRKPSRL